MVLCRVCARVFLRPSLSFPSSLHVRLDSAAVLTAVGVHVSLVSILATGVARDVRLVVVAWHELTPKAILFVAIGNTGSPA